MISPEMPLIHFVVPLILSDDPRASAKFLVEHMDAQVHGGNESFDSPDRTGNKIRLLLGNVDIDLELNPAPPDRRYHVGMFTIPCANRDEWEEWNEYLGAITPPLGKNSKTEGEPHIQATSCWDIPGLVRMKIEWKAAQKNADSLY